MAEEAILKEYYAILEVVREFDGRLLTVKGWGVTMSLAALGWGFEKMHYGLFLVAALSGVGFWLIEAIMKRHQMRYYLRMRTIEIIAYEQAGKLNAADQSSPRIDWSWANAPQVYSGASVCFREKPGLEPLPQYALAWLFPHVFLPHLLSVAFGTLLLFAGRAGLLGQMSW
jgi:hypothetical protein